MKDYPCPCCDEEFDTRADKSQHLLEEHEYELLNTELVEDTEIVEAMSKDDTSS